MFENKIIRCAYASQYIISWVREGGTLDEDWDDDNNHKIGGLVEFRNWLKSLGLEDEEVRYIYRLAGNGKHELEVSARKFLKATKE